MRRILSAVSFILAVTVVVGILYLGYWSQTTFGPKSTPMLLYNSTIYSDTGVASDVLNASQGSTQQLNLTLTGYGFSPSIAVPVGNIMITAYNSTIDYGGNWATGNWSNSVVQASVFNYSFSLNTLTLQPNTSNSTIITINWANNAPTGRYVVEINLSDFKFLSTQGKYDLTYGSSIWLGIVVTAKINN